MKPAFEEYKVDQALGKIAEVIRQPSGGHGAPSWAEATSKDVVAALEQLQERMRAQHISLQHGAFPRAIYAARELNKYIAGARSDVPNNDAAQVFHHSLAAAIEELRPLDQKLAEERAA